MMQISSRKRSLQSTQPFSSSLSTSQYAATKSSLKFKNDFFDSDELISDWRTAIQGTSGGKMMKNAADKVWHIATFLASALIHLIGETAAWMENKVFPESSTSTTATSSRSSPSSSTTTRTTSRSFDTRSTGTTTHARSTATKPQVIVEDDTVGDEDLFRSIFGVSDDSASSMIDLVVSQATNLMKGNKIATNLLGYSFKFGKILSQKSQLSTSPTNGKLIRTIQLRFEVVGGGGQKGIATVMSNDDHILSLDLEVNGRMYRMPTNQAASRKTRTSSSSSSSFSSTSTRTGKHDDSSVVDVEVMKGIYWPTRESLKAEHIIDAVIEGKTFL